MKRKSPKQHKVTRNGKTFSRGKGGDTSPKWGKEINKLFDKHEKISNGVIGKLTEKLKPKSQDKYFDLLAQKQDSPTPPKNIDKKISDHVKKHQRLFGGHPSDKYSTAHGSPYRGKTLNQIVNIHKESKRTRKTGRSKPSPIKVSRRKRQ